MGPVRMHLEAFLAENRDRVLELDRFPRGQRVPRYQPIPRCQLPDIEIRTLGGTCYHFGSSFASLSDIKIELQRCSGIPCDEQRLMVGSSEVMEKDLALLVASPMATIVRRPPEQVWWLSWLRDGFCNEREVVEHFQHAPDYIREDHEIVIAATRISASAFKFAGSEIRGNREIFLRVLSDFGKWYEPRFRPRPAFALIMDNVPESFYNDREIMLGAIEACSGFASKLHQYASSDIRADRAVVLAAIQSAGPLAAALYEEAPSGIRADYSVVLATLQASERADELFACLPQGFRENKECVMAAFNGLMRSQHGLRVLDMHRQLPGAMRTDFDIVSAAWMHVRNHIKPWTHPDQIPSYVEVCDVVFDVWRAQSRYIGVSNKPWSLSIAKPAVTRQQVLSLVCGCYHIHQLRHFRHRMDAEQPTMLPKSLPRPSAQQNCCCCDIMSVNFQMRLKRAMSQQKALHKRYLVGVRRHATSQEKLQNNSGSQLGAFGANRKHLLRVGGFHKQSSRKLQNLTHEASSSYKEWLDRDWDNWHDICMFGEWEHDYYVEDWW